MTVELGLRWRGKWVWAGPSLLGLDGLDPSLEDRTDRFVLLRRPFNLGAPPREAPARVTADSRYVLYVNGEEVARGPVRSNPRRLRYDTVDLAPHLRRGDNVVAALARWYGRPRAWWMPVPITYTFGAGAFVFEADVGDTWIVSDDSWRATLGEAWSPRRPSGISAALPEVHDARRMPLGWTEPGFDDSGWEAARVLVPVHIGSDANPSPPTHPYGPLLARPVPALSGETRLAHLVGHVRVEGGDEYESPIVQVESDEASAPDDAGAVELLTFDFGGIVAGLLELEVDAPSGTRLDISCAEHLYPDGRLCRLNQETGLRYVTRGDPEDDEVFRTFDPVGTRYVRVAVRGEGPLEDLELRVHERHRPRPPGPGFECSDPRLTRIYEIGLRTVDLCAHDAYVDCPTREQRAWTGDSVVHQMVDLAANPDWSLARHHPVLTASPRPDGMLPMVVACDFEHDDRSFIPDWPLHWIRAVLNLQRFTGDRDLVASLLPFAEGVLRWFLPFRGADGLLHDVTGWVLIDWSSVYSSGTSSALNALWARGLRDFAETADWLDDRGRAAWARRCFEDVAASFDVFWDEQRGVYVDHLVEGVPQRPAAQHGGAAALAAGLVPEERRSRVLERLLDRSRLIRHSWAMDSATPEGDWSGSVGLAFPRPDPEWDVENEMVEAQPFFRYVVHDAAVECGRADLIPDRCLDWQVFVDAGETSWPECWKGGTHCHGWSSTPTRDLVWYTLGVTPAEPGFSRVRVAPRLGGLEWVAGAAPTPHGLVTVRADRQQVEVDSPVPVVLDPGDGPSDGPPVHLPAGHHTHRLDP